MRRPAPGYIGAEHHHATHFLAVGWLLAETKSVIDLLSAKETRLLSHRWANLSRIRIGFLNSVSAAPSD